MPPRAVADTNVFVAAATAPTGTCGRLVTAIAQQRWQPVFCPMLVDELTDVLYRDKFRRWIGVDDVVSFIRDVRILAHEVPDPAVIAGVTPDPDDDYLIALAAAARVDTVISGDAHLRRADTGGIRVVSPGGFLRELA
jgi:putative PIN family toxin of toxin-antitoxin system